MNILQISSSPNLHSSATRKIGGELVGALIAQNPGAIVTIRDLVSAPLPYYSPEYLAGWYTTDKSGSEYLLVRDAVAELKAAQIVVIEVPMINFGVPATLKSWLDHIVVPGLTFQYGANGPESLLATKPKIYLVAASGGSYEDEAYKAFEHAKSHLISALGFIGLTDIEVILVSNMARGEEAVAQSFAAAEAQIAKIIA